ncbi:MAG: AAA family ATPase [Verrucomicrobia bacterium]|jgi:predicted ATPase|nr:AAA family ATPase [Verrucomicrobiota bacterium]OQC68115.1 MAG: DNA replication and repair protein RecF [Verrucomicrobia bacterium ADurb.Bin006]NMD22359.1 AAA family ATPase [Verrucomicrobiota bacterium]HOA62126.1 AAA family ATPase [Verrucomicrobiota bacterium]HOF48699.1 AAA family ATPase [Verrucomicrobiota bacterium]
MITRIEAYRYRCFERLDLALDRFQVFVGPNGAGKTTLLDIPIVLGEMLAARSIEKAFFKETPSHPRQRTDYARDLIYTRAGNNFIMAVEARLPESIIAELVDKQAKRLEKRKFSDSGRAVKALREKRDRWFSRIRYEIEFELFNEALQIGQEYLLLLSEGADTRKRAPSGLLGEWVSPGSRQIVPVLRRPRGGKVTFRPEGEARGPRNEYGFPVTEPAFANVFADRSRYGASLWLRDLLTNFACAYQPSFAALRDPQPRIQQPVVVRDASTLAWLAKDLEKPTDAEQAKSKAKLTRSRAFERWERLARLALPGLVRIEPFVRDDDKHAYLRLHYRNGAVVPSSGLSDGTLTILALTILSFLPSTPALLTYEEPEDGVHPKGIEILLEALQTVHGSQVFVSSHSPLVLARCQPSQIVCMSLDPKGAATAVRGDQHPALTEWKESVNLGTLLAAGVLG